MATISHQSFVFSSKNNWGREVHTWAWRADKHTEKRGAGGGCHAHYWQTKILGKISDWKTHSRALECFDLFFSLVTQRLKFVVVELGKFFLSHNNLTENLVCYLVVFLASFLVSRLFMFIVENWRKTPNWWFFIVRRVLLWVLLRHQCHRDLRRQVRPHPLQRHLQLQRLQPQPQP